jgi:NADH-quinone oxidoreductase subunit I
MKIVKRTVSGIYNLLLGMSVTIKYLFSHAVTLQYPKERWKMPERSRGMVVLTTDKEKNELKCTGCGLCYKICPNNAIKVTRQKDETGKLLLHPEIFELDVAMCIYCGLCQEICPVKGKAIKLVPKYEFSAYDKKGFVYNKDKLQKEGMEFE